MYFLKDYLFVGFLCKIATNSLVYAISYQTHFKFIFLLFIKKYDLCVLPSLKDKGKCYKTGPDRVVISFFLKKCQKFKNCLFLLISSTFYADINDTKILANRPTLKGCQNLTVQYFDFWFSALFFPGTTRKSTFDNVTQPFKKY